MDGDILEVRGELFEHAEPLFGREKACFVGIVRDDDIKLVKKTASPLDDIEMPVRGRVESSREYCGSHNKITVTCLTDCYK